MKLSIIIVGLNTKKWVISCLKSIFANKPEFSFEVIYVDNGSTDGSVEEIKRFPVKIIENKKNLGFTKANNIGISKSSGEILFFLNPDTKILGNTLSKMVRFLEKNPEIGVLGPRLYNSEKKDLQISYGGKLTPTVALFSLTFLKKLFPKNIFFKKYFLTLPEKKIPTEVEVVSGAALMIKKDIFEKIGGFDERFFAYFEENDLCLRVKKIGKKVVYFPMGEIIHYGGKATKNIPELSRKIFVQSRFKFFKKHYGALPALMTEGFMRFFENLSLKNADNLKKKIFLNTFYQVLGKLTTSFLGFLSTILIARHLGAVYFGQFSLIYIFLGLVAIFADFGLVTLLVRELASKKADSRFESGILSLRLFCFLAIFCIFLAILPFLPYPEIVKKGIVVALLGNLFLSLSAVYWGIFQAKIDFLKIVLIQVFSSFLAAVLVIFGVWKNLPFLYFVYCLALSNLAGFLLSLFWSPKIKLIFDIFLFKKILKEVWPIGLGAIVSTFYFKIDSLLVSLFFNPESFPDLGYYSAAYKYFEVAGVFAGFFQTTVFPIISANLGKKNFDLVYKKILKYGVGLSILSFLGLFLFSWPLILFYGKEFLPAVNSLRILSLSLGISVISGIWLSVGVAGGKQKTLFWFSLAALFLNLFSNLLVIPKYSFVGASWTTVLTQIFIGLTNFWVASKVVK